MKRPADDPPAGRPPVNKIEDVELLNVTNRVPNISHLMFGASGLGCLYRDVTPEEANMCLDAVVAAGITYVDTAPWYGAGLSESRVGDYFCGRSGVKFSTKCGRVIRPKSEVGEGGRQSEPGYADSFQTAAYHQNVPVADYTADGVRESFKQSCERMRLSSIDCLRLHDAEDPARWVEATKGGGVDAMVELRSQGHIREVSMGMNSSEYMLKFLGNFPKGTFDNIMMAGCFNLIDQDGLPLLLECQRLGVKVTNVGVFASGLLWGSTHYKYEGAPPAVMEKARLWKKLAEKHGLTLPEVALSFSLLPDVVEMVAFGCKTPEQVKANLDLCGKAVPLELWAEARSAGLIAEDVPIPVS